MVDTTGLRSQLFLPDIPTPLDEDWRWKTPRLYKLALNERLN